MRFIKDLELVLGLRYKFGVIWSDLGSGKTQGKTQVSGLAKERRSAVLARRGARLFLGRASSLTCWAPRLKLAGRRDPIGLRRGARPISEHRILQF